MGSLDNHCLSTLFPRPGKGPEERLLGENTAGPGGGDGGGTPSCEGTRLQTKEPWGPWQGSRKPPRSRGSEDAEHRGGTEKQRVQSGLAGRWARGRRGDVLATLSKRRQREVGGWKQEPGPARPGPDGNREVTPSPFRMGLGGRDRGQHGTRLSR